MKKLLCLTLVSSLLWSCVSPIPIHRFEEEIPKLVPFYTLTNGLHIQKFDNSTYFPRTVE